MKGDQIHYAFTRGGVCFRIALEPKNANQTRVIQQGRFLERPGEIKVQVKVQVKGQGYVSGDMPGDILVAGQVCKVATIDFV